MTSFQSVCRLALAWVVCVLSVNASAKADEEMLTIGSSAPAIDIEHWVSQGGGKFDKVTKFEDGKVYIIEFWATWCGPCIASMPHLADLQSNYADKGVQLISVSDEELDVVQSFLDRPVKGSEDEQQTYGKLTSVYCLTTDPDRSVHEAYMEAAGQNGIPTAFIVGKDGRIEWIGHPMRMDDPLQQVIAGKWDREVAKAEMLAAQRRGMITTQISKAMRSGDADKAMEIIDKALEEYSDDSELVAFLSRVRVQVQVFPVTQLAREGKHQEALEKLEELKKKAPEHLATFTEFQLSVLLNGNMFDQAANVLNEVVAAESDPVKLNQIGWMIFETSQQNEEFSDKLLAAATAAAKKASELAPEEGAVLDTYAHLLHRSGKLDEAIKVQTEAAKLVGDGNPDVKAFLEALIQEKDGAGKSE
jgi:thiol-disulfide isomerase/thioredoxin/Flp pilus assembly protein TadD